MLNRQVAFEDLPYYQRKKITRKQKMLSTMDKIMPWKDMLDSIRPFSPKAERGRPPIPLPTMLRIYCMQQWFGYSDPAMEDALYDNVSVRIFAGVDVNTVPDETTICRFRHLLEQHDLTKELLSISAQVLTDHGILVRSGTIVDATIISAPSSTKNQKRQRDPEMKQTKKGNTWHFGMKVHVGTDTQGLVHSVVVTPANTHDATVMQDCLHGEEEEIYGDKAYVSAARKKAAEAAGKRWRVLRKGTATRKLSAADRAFNRDSNRTRAKVEHVFGVVKHQWGYRNVRYRGLRKNAAHVYTLFALANLYMARQRLAATMG